MQIGILGLGTVGKGVFEILNSVNFVNYNINIKKALVRDLNKYNTIEFNELEITTNPYDILDDSNIDTIVEVMGGIEKPYEYIKYALTHKKNVITANKAVLANHFEEFLLLSRDNNVTLLFEASVGGGIPLIKPLKENSRINNFHEISGILNGTSNFILSKMSKEGIDFTRALQIAQEKGYAEQDPSDDIDGIDVARKLTLLSSIVFKKYLPLSEIVIFGIRNIKKYDMEIAKSYDLDIKLIGKSNFKSNAYQAIVEPVLITKKSLFSNVDDAFNIAMAKGDCLKEVSFYGEGAGKLATANAVVSDLLDVYFKNNIEALEIDFTESNFINEPSNYYLRCSQDSKLNFDYINSSNNQIMVKSLDNDVYVIENISIDNLNKLIDTQINDKSSYFVAGLSDEAYKVIISKLENK